jgi:hypothetical protein
MEPAAVKTGTCTKGVAKNLRESFGNQSAGREKVG